MNKNKNGKPFTFLNSFIQVFSYIRYFFHLPYRQTEGIIKVIGKVYRQTSYSHVCKRINRLNLNITKDKTEDDNLVIAIHSNGTKVTNRGQRMNEKWNIRNKKGYLKINVTENIKTK